MEELREQRFDEYVFSTDNNLLDISLIHHYLCFESYWAKNIPLLVVQASIVNSLCFGIYHENKQVGFARVISDVATFGYLADVFIVKEHRKKGLSKLLMQFILDTSNIKTFRRFMLGTRDAQSLYAQFGFEPLKAPERFMEIHQPEVYNNLLNHQLL